MFRSKKSSSRPNSPQSQERQEEKITHSNSQPSTPQTQERQEIQSEKQTNNNSLPLSPHHQEKKEKKSTGKPSSPHKKERREIKLEKKNNSNNQEQKEKKSTSKPSSPQNQERVEQIKNQEKKEGKINSNSPRASYREKYSFKSFSRKNLLKPINNNSFIDEEKQSSSESSIISDLSFENLFNEKKDPEFFRATAAYLYLFDRQQDAIEKQNLCIFEDRFNILWSMEVSRQPLFIQKQIMLWVKELINQHLAYAYEKAQNKSTDSFKEIQLYIQTVVRVLCTIDLDLTYEFHGVKANPQDSFKASKLVFELCARRCVEKLAIKNLPMFLQVSIKENANQEELNDYNKILEEIVKLKMELNEVALCAQDTVIQGELEMGRFQYQSGNFISVKEITKQFEQANQKDELIMLKRILDILYNLEGKFSLNIQDKNLLVNRNDIPNFKEEITTLNSIEVKTYCRQINLGIAAVVYYFILSLKEEDISKLKENQQQIAELHEDKHNPTLPIIEKIEWLYENTLNFKKIFSLSTVIKAFHKNNPLEIKQYSDEAKEKLEQHKLYFYYSKVGAEFCFTDEKLMFLILLYYVTDDKEIGRELCDECIIVLENVINPKIQISEKPNSNPTTPQNQVRREENQPEKKTNTNSQSSFAEAYGMFATDGKSGEQQNINTKPEDIIENDGNSGEQINITPEDIIEEESYEKIQSPTLTSSGTMF